MTREAAPASPRRSDETSLALRGTSSPPGRMAICPVIRRVGPMDLDSFGLGVDEARECGDPRPNPAEWGRRGARGTRCADVDKVAGRGDLPRIPNTWQALLAGRSAGPSPPTALHPAPASCRFAYDLPATRESSCIPRPPQCRTRRRDDRQRNQARDVHLLGGPHDAILTAGERVVVDRSASDAFARGRRPPTMKTRPGSVGPGGNAGSPGRWERDDARMTEARKELPLVALTMGDVAGIGPEVIARAWLNPALHAMARPMVIGDPDILERAARLVVPGGDLDIQVVGAPEEAAPSPRTIPCLPVMERVRRSDRGPARDGRSPCRPRRLRVPECRDRSRSRTSHRRDRDAPAEQAGTARGRRGSPRAYGDPGRTLQGPGSRDDAVSRDRPGRHES